MIAALLRRMHSSDAHGINTTVSGIAPEFLELWAQLNTTADELGLPEQWIVCPLCGVQGWRLPSHGYGEPCPIAQEMYESAGMKLDAERSTAIRMGVGLEEAMRQMREMMEDDDV